ncbi:ATP-binding cassette domain-containing protein [Tyzzerella sp. OttesenSCG-928-J15]|nr:ATP-binding cassette domain-containing protein [Tyzzerella sp. OttesenSCG-928-J15]
MSEHILEIKNVSKSFKLPRTNLFEKRSYIKALNNVSLNIEKGQIVGIVGESGSGKSTLGRIIVKLLEADSGQIIYNGTDITRLSHKEFAPYRKDIQMVFQNAYSSLNPNKTIGWLLKESLDINTDLSDSQKKIRVDEVFDMVGLKNTLKTRYPGELSGGERQRAVIALAIMLEPKIIVADEAVSALDVSVSAQILNLMAELRDKLDLSYIFISHDLSVVNYISDYIAIIQNGEIVEQGQSDEVFRNPETNYAKQLLEGTFIYNLPS